MRRILLAALAALTAAGPLCADPLFKTRYLGFDDVNGDGKLSCGETVTIGVFYQTDAPGPEGLADPTELHGFITMPESDSNGLFFLPGSVTTDFGFTTGCYANVLAGNAPGDFRARVEAICTQDPTILPGGATLALKYQAVYQNPTSPSFTDTATFLFDQRPPGAGDRLHSADFKTGLTGTCSAPPPVVTIRKSVMGAADPGAHLVYQLAITNSSALPLGGFYARDVVPAHTTFDPGNSSPGWTCSAGGAAGASCSYLFSALPVGTSTLSFAVLVDSPIPPNVPNISNTACVAESQTVYGCDSISTPAGGSPRLAVTKTITGGTPAAPGSVVSFEVAVENTGNRGSSDVIVSDTLPPGTTYVSSGSGTWSCSGGTCTADLGTLAAGESKRIAISLLVPSSLPAGVNSFTNTACASPLEGGAPACSSATLGVSGAPVLNLKKTLARGDGTPGAPLTFALLVRNDGNQDAAGVTVTETLPPHTSPDLAASEPGWTCSPPTCTFSLGALAAGQERSLAFVVVVDKPLAAGVTQITNTACAAASGVATACDTIEVASQGKVVLETRKTILPPTADKARALGGKVFSGDTVVYQIAIASAGDQDAAGVVLHETVPAYTTFDVAASDAGWSCAGGGAAGAACSLSIGALAAGESATRLFAVQVGTLPDGVFSVRNVACAEDASGTASCGEIDTPPNAPTSLEAKLTARLVDDPDGSGDITPGDVLEYTAAVRNLGDVKAAAVVFQINAPRSTVFQAGTVIASMGSVVTGNGPSDASVKVDFGDLDAGSTATVTYRVTVPASLDAAVTEIVSQGGVLGGNAAAVLTDDPATPAVLDPTVTPVRHVEGPHAVEVPTLGQAGMLILALGLAGTGARWVRRKSGKTP
ncbi:MAG TPA: hypothetical protein VFR03_07070 [Thermoanaerobaculia bacterium]|nr:hypothetical protein [Thermoanaerobaculia bacterium]